MGCLKLAHTVVEKPSLRVVYACDEHQKSGVRMYDYGFRYYDPVVARWFVPDPLAEIHPNLTPYRFGFNNPIRFTDVAGLTESDGLSVTFKPGDEGWEDLLGMLGIGSNTSENEDDEDDKDKEKKKKQSSWAKQAGEFYASVYAGSSNYKSMFSKLYESNTSIDGLNKLFDAAYQNPDVSGIILSGNGFFAGGMGLDFAIVSVADDGMYLLINVRGGIGGDISASLGAIIGNSKLGTPDGETLRGGNLSETFGALGISVTHWSDFDVATKTVGRTWEGVATQLTLGSKTAVGGNVSFGNTYAIKLSGQSND